MTLIILAQFETVLQFCEKTSTQDHAFRDKPDCKRQFELSNGFFQLQERTVNSEQ